MKATIRAIVPLLLALTGCKESILHGLEEEKANRVTMVLERVGIDSSKSKSGLLWDIQVAADDRMRSLRALERSRLLTRDQGRFKDQDTALVPTDNQQLINTERQISWSLEETLERVPGIVEAKVHLFMNRRERVLSLNQELGVRSASVLLVTENEQSVVTTEIKQLVSGATGATLDQINVVARTISEQVDPLPILAPPSKIEHSPVPLSRSNRILSLLVGGLTLGSIIWILIRRRSSPTRLTPALAARNPRTFNREVLDHQVVEELNGER